MPESEGSFGLGRERVAERHGPAAQAGRSTLVQHRQLKLT